MRSSWMVVAGLALAGGCVSHELRKFPDRPVAWEEHDDTDVARKPRGSDWNELPLTTFARSEVYGIIDGRLKITVAMPAADVNSLDEVPCSTWFCPRNHLQPLSPEELVAGDPTWQEPVPPFRIVSSKAIGATAGFIVKDRRNRKFIMKFDPRGKLALTTAPDFIGNRLFWAAGYNTPGAFLVEVVPEELSVEPGATFVYHRYNRRPFTTALRDQSLASLARTPEGRVRAVMIPFIEGEILGGFQFHGRRSDDPNDRIPHQHRRSLRASMVIAAWLNYGDVGALNTIDTYVKDGRRRFVKHYIVDFGATLGSWSKWAKYPYQTERSQMGFFGALFGLGVRQHSWQRDRDAWERTVRERPAIGWLEAETWRPRTFRTAQRSNAHHRMTDRDAYWGAKVVASFTDPQIDSLVAAAGYQPEDALAVAHALKVRRDKIAETYLVDVTALEDPRVAGDRLCWRDLALDTGVLTPAELQLDVRVRDERGQELVTARWQPQSPVACISLDHHRGYKVVTVTSIVRGKPEQSAHVHLRWRPAERRYAIIGLDRDD
jgi:hypothetical protein